VTAYLKPGDVVHIVAPVLSVEENAKLTDEFIKVYAVFGVTVSMVTHSLNCEQPVVVSVIRKTDEAIPVRIQGEGEPVTNALVDRIRARINQVEQRANAAIEEMRCTCHPDADFSRWKYRDGEAVVLDDAPVHAVYHVHQDDRGLGRHFEINDPYLTLQRVESDRRLLDRFELEAAPEPGMPQGSYVGYAAGLWIAVGFMAQSYAIDVFE
jgi:hypothetical protein